jgi:DNA-binding response OmpR family regulator
MANTPKRIIIIEDEVFIADLYARQLNKAGYLVKTVNDGTAGLQELNQSEYDLLLLDIMLPGLNGLEILRQFKLTHPQSKMIIFLLTNLGQDTVIKEAFQLGANGYLIKAAYTPDQILVEVKKALDAAPQPPPSA